MGDVSELSGGIACPTKRPIKSESMPHTGDVKRLVAFAFTHRLVRRHRRCVGGGSSRLAQGSDAMHTKATICLLAIFAVFAICPMAWAAPEMPAKLAAEFPPYSGSTVVDATNSPMIVQAVLNCGSASEQKVYAFYKKQAAKKGWKIMAERMEKGFHHLMISKPGMNGNIAVGSADGKTAASITLMKSMGR